MNTILLVGEDAMLLQTRAAVLAKTGAEVVCCAPNAALTMQADRECDLVVLCHSVAEALSLALAETIHARWPKTKVLQVVSRREWDSVDAKAAVDAISSAEPERLIQQTTKLLKRGRMPSESERDVWSA
jgi:DNA-binding NarL/FixJ family response regulator